MISLSRRTLGATLLVCMALSACQTATPNKSVPRISEQECKHMHGRGNINLEQLRECRMTGKVQAAEMQSQ